MIRKFKALGLAMVAVLAMSAVVASAAQAQFTSDKYPTTVTAESALGNDVFTVDGSTVECAGHFSGTATEASTTMTIDAVYTSCKAFGFASATVHMNGCDYVFHSNGEVDIVCHKFVKNAKEEIETVAEGPITITAGNCEVQVGAQNGLKSVGLTNNGNHIDVLANVSGITANVTKRGFLCPLSGTGHKLSTYKQGTKVTVKPVSGGTDLTIH